MVTSSIKSSAPSSRLPEAEITINGRVLSQTQAGAFRLALQIAKHDLDRTSGTDLFLVGVRQNVSNLLELIDETEVTL